MINLRNFKNIIFDFDGTIADSLSIHDNAFKEVLKPHSLNFNYYDYGGMSTANAFKLIFEQNNTAISDADLGKLVTSKQEMANLHYQRSIEFIDGAGDFIRQLAAQGKNLFVASSGSRPNVETGLKKLGVFSYFTAVVTSNDVSHAKPDPEIFLKVIKDFNLDKKETLIIEDANSGLTAAVRAKVEVVCINENIELHQLNKNIRIISYSALLNLLDD